MQVAILWVLALSGNAVGSSDQADQITTMNDAIKYLREIDKYYAQVARPRYEFRVPLMKIK